MVVLENYKKLILHILNHTKWLLKILLFYFLIIHFNYSKEYSNDVKDITNTIRSVNDLNIAIKDFEHSSFEISKENHSLK